MERKDYDFEFMGETFAAFPQEDGTVQIMDKDGCTINFDSIQDFMREAEAEGGAEMLSGWEY
jgi:hypothetical protein